MDVRSLLWHYPSQPYKFLHKGKGMAIPTPAQRVPGGWGSQILSHWEHEGGKVSPTYQPPIPLQSFFLALIPVGGCVDSRTTVQPEGLMSTKNSKDSIGNRTCDPLTIPPRATFFLHTGNIKYEYYFNQKRWNDGITSSSFDSVFSGSQQVSLLPT